MDLEIGKEWFAGIPLRLSQARSRQRLTPPHVSLLAGLDSTACADIESRLADCNLTLGTLEQLAWAMGVSAAWLAFGEGPFKLPADRRSAAAGLAKRLLDVRVQQRIHQTGLNVGAILHRFAGKRASEGPVDGPNLLVSVLESLARSLGVSPGWLAFGLGKEPGPMPEVLVDGARPVAPRSRRKRARQHHPFSHRAALGSLYDDGLPALPERFDPLLVALGARQPFAVRKEIRHGLFAVLCGPDREAAMQQVRHLLEQAVPESERHLVAEVLAELQCDDPVRRGTMALQLLIDAGLPVSGAEMDWLIQRPHPEALEPALDTATEILFTAVPDASASSLNRQICGGQSEFEGPPSDFRALMN